MKPLSQHPELRTERPGVIPCFGIQCDHHTDCQCYAAVNFSDPHSLRMGFCPQRADGSRTMFIPIKEARHA